MVTSSGMGFTAIVIDILVVLVILSPFLILYLALRANRKIVARRETESRRLMNEMIDLLKENNRLLKQKLNDRESPRQDPPHG